MLSQPVLDKQREEFGIFVERFMHFMNVWTIYSDLLSGRYVPTIRPHAKSAHEWTHTDISATMMFMLYAFFYSLIEDDENSINAFRLWRERYSEVESAIAALEKEVVPLRRTLKKFRNRLGFHGSRSRAYRQGDWSCFPNDQEQRRATSFLDHESWTSRPSSLEQRPAGSRATGPGTARILRAAVSAESNP